MTEPNIVAVFGTTVVAMIIGAIWYHPKVFGKMWMKYIGFKPDEIKSSSMGKSYGLMFLGALVGTYILSQVVGFMNSQTALDGAQAGFLMWLGFVATTSIGDVLFGKKPWGMYLLQVSHHLVALMISGAVLAVWV